jgi:hypothetical protein
MGKFFQSDVICSYLMYPTGKFKSSCFQQQASGNDYFYIFLPKFITHMKRILLAILFIGPASLLAQTKVESKKVTVADSPLGSSYKWRCVGPARGGRSGAVAGVWKETNTFYFGATGGGVSLKQPMVGATGVTFLINILAAVLVPFPLPTRIAILYG